MRHLSKVVLATSLALSLSGCSLLGKLDPNITTHQPIPVPENQQPAPMSLKPVTWKVYNAAEMKAAIQQMEARGQTDSVFYVLSKEDYEALAFNFADMKRYIADQKAINEFLIEAIRINNGEKKPEPAGK